MKKIIVALCVILLTACSKTDTVSKINDDLMKSFPVDVQLYLKDLDPDIVSMEYLLNNPEDYVSKLGENKFVLVKGNVTDITVIDYSKEDLSIMENQEMADLLKDVVVYDYYIDDTKTPLSDNLGNTDVRIDKEYYFLVSVRDQIGEYTYSVIDIY